MPKPLPRRLAAVLAAALLVGGAGATATASAAFAGAATATTYWYDQSNRPAQPDPTSGDPGDGTVTIQDLPAEAPDGTFTLDFSASCMGATDDGEDPYIVFTLFNPGHTEYRSARPTAAWDTSGPVPTLTETMTLSFPTDWAFTDVYFQAGMSHCFDPAQGDGIHVNLGQVPLHAAVEPDPDPSSSSPAPDPDPIDPCAALPGQSTTGEDDWQTTVTSTTKPYSTTWRGADYASISDAYGTSAEARLQSDAYDGLDSSPKLDSADLQTVCTTTDGLTDHAALNGPAGLTVQRQTHYYASADLARRAFVFTNTSDSVRAASTFSVESDLGSDNWSYLLGSDARSAVFADGSGSDPVNTFLWGGAIDTGSSSMLDSAPIASTEQDAGTHSLGWAADAAELSSAYFSGLGDAAVLNWGAHPVLPEVLGSDRPNDYDLAHGAPIGTLAAGANVSEIFRATFALPELQPGQSVAVVQFNHLEYYGTAWQLPGTITAGDAYADRIGYAYGAWRYRLIPGGAALPAGITLHEDGTLTGTSTAAPGTYSVRVQVIDPDSDEGWASRTIDLVVAEPSTPGPAWGEASLGTLQRDVAVDAALGATGDALTYRVVDGGLPAGLTLSSAGRITGTPTTVGTYSVTIRATDAHGRTADHVFTGSVVDATLQLRLGFEAGDNLAEAKTTASATGLKPGTEWTLQLFSTPRTIASGTVDDSGLIGRVVDLPSDTPAGAHRLLLTATAADGTSRTAEAWFAIDAQGRITAVSYDGPVAAPAAAGLAFTGGTVGVLGVGLMIALLAVGGTLLLVGRARAKRVSRT